VRSNEHILRTRDGQLIATNQYVPSSERSGKALVIAPEAGVEQAFYQPFATWCAARGIAVFTFDYRGAGQSAHHNQNHHQPTLRQWANQDLDAVLWYVHRLFPSDEIILMAHGLSGQIAGSAAATEHVGYLVLVGCALHSRRLWPLGSRIQAWFQSLPAPREQIWARKFLPAMDKLPAGLMRDLMDWSSRRNGLFDIFPDTNFRRLNIPLLAFSFADDPFAPRRAVAELLTHYCPSCTDWLHVRPADFDQATIGHSGFFEPRCEKLWLYFLDWVQETIVERRYFF